MLMAFFLFLGAAAQGWQTYKVRKHGDGWLENRAAHYAGSHATMLFIMGVMVLTHSRHWLLVIIMMATVLPSLFWSLYDISKKV